MTYAPSVQSESSHGSFGMYLIGFLLSVGLTVAAYLLAIHYPLSHLSIILAIVGLGVVQLLVQLIFFLHLGNESKPRWNLTVLLFAGIIVCILVGGSIWIMRHLNYNMSTPDISNYIIQDEGIQK